jgi:hypothetical protein
MRTGLALVSAALLALGASSAFAVIDCEPARCNPQLQSDLSACPCPEASNHGRYVSCVAHTVNKAARDGTIARNCKGKVVRCAAHSTCGKPDFVVCRIPVVFGACDPATNTCSSGTSINADGSCAADTDCVVEFKCKIKRDTRCAALGGIADPTATTCCAACPQ